jgi:hypothetical protein
LLLMLLDRSGASAHHSRHRSFVLLHQNVAKKRQKKLLNSAEGKEER